jgi:hypothetical protein
MIKEFAPTRKILDDRRKWQSQLSVWSSQRWRKFERQLITRHASRELRSHDCNSLPL